MTLLIEMSTILGRRGYIYNHVTKVLNSYLHNKNEMTYDHEWNPCEKLSNHAKLNYALVILNTPIDFNFNTDFILKLWNNAKVRLTVDGGTERWVSWLNQNKYDIQQVLAPDLITGDMDSTPRDILKLFETTTARIIRTPDQMHTDFTKSLMILSEHCKNESVPIDTVFVLADTCGRLDQIMANINTLFKAKDLLPNVSIFQVATNSISWLLWKGSHKINIPQNLRNNQEWCALLPIGSACHITTTGLKWNLDNGLLEFGGMVSSSNTYDNSPVVTVQTNNTILWSMGIDSLL